MRAVVRVLTMNTVWQGVYITWCSLVILLKSSLTVAGLLPLFSSNHRTISESRMSSMMSAVHTFDSSMTPLFSCGYLLGMCVLNQWALMQESYMTNYDVILCIIGSMYGITGVQIYSYFIRYSRDDNIPMKALVLLIFGAIPFHLQLTRATRSGSCGKWPRLICSVFI
jgi:hypothetical protein